MFTKARSATINAACCSLVVATLAGCAPRLTALVTFPDAPAPPVVADLGSVADVVGAPVVAIEGVPAQITGRLLRESEWDAVLQHDAALHETIDDIEAAWLDLLAALERDRAHCEAKDAAMVEALKRARRSYFEGLGLGFLAGGAACEALESAARFRQ